MTTTEQNIPIFPAKTGVISFRDAGYRDTSMALAELIDNSIQAKADTIRIMAFSEVVIGKKRNHSQITKLAVFDDGEGMSADVMRYCLGFAQGTRLNKRDGIGRFGVGLPLASISQCKRVSVYSWQNSETPNYVYLDIKEIENQDQQFLNPVQSKELPEDISAVISKHMSESGTVVIWENCDRTVKRPKTLFSRMEKGFCRIYRHFLDDDDTYGRKRDIKLVAIEESEVTEFKLKPNDPLYLMTPNNLPGYEMEATNTIFENPILEKIEYEPGKFSEIQIRSSIIRQDIGRWKDGNSTKPIRDHYRNNVGISFVRSGREIDFGIFNYFNPTELKERYWGIEIRFEPLLDELFGVTNNKQNVRGIEKIDADEFDSSEEHDESDYNLLLRHVLSEKISSLLSGIRLDVNNMAPGSEENSVENQPGFTDSETASERVKDNPAKTKTKQEAESKSETQKDEEREDLVKESDPSLTEDQVKEGAEKLKQLELAISFGSWPGDLFMTRKGVGDTAVVQINRNHPFYSELYSRVVSDPDSQQSKALNLFLLAFLRAEEEMYNDSVTIERLRNKWGSQLSEFIAATKE